MICHLRSIPTEGGRIHLLQGSAQPAGQGSNAAIAAKSAEVPNGTFMTRHTCDMKFSYVSERYFLKKFYKKKKKKEGKIQKKSGSKVIL